MVLESIINPLKAEKKPVTMFFIGAIYSSVALFLGLWIFRDYASLVIIFLTVLACTPLMYNTIRIEEKKDMEIEAESTILKEHGRALLFFMMLFCGVTISFTFWYTILPFLHSIFPSLIPADIISSAFSVQLNTIMEMNGGVTGYVNSDFAVFSGIFLNNVKVLIFCIIFAFLYGFGAIFILVWNASVIAVAMGEFFRNKIAVITASIGGVGITSYVSISLYTLLRYTPHGLLEILAYFVAGLAGGIISIAIIRHDFRTNKFEKIIFDAANLIMISFLIIFVAALVETFITPLFFQ